MDTRLLRKLFALTAVFAVLALVVSACGGGDEEAPAPTAAPTARPAVAPTATPVPATPTPVQPKRGGVLQARLTNPFTSWDTYDARGGFSFIHVANMVNSLIHLDLKDVSKVVPDLAESYAVSQDGKTYTFRVRQGVQWHDGKPFTSADVLYNLNTAWKPAAPRVFNAQFTRRITGITATDQATVQVTVDRPSASFLPGLATPHMLMYPAHLQDMAAWQKAPIGTGPFKFKSYRTDVLLEYQRNEDYFKKDEQGRALPFLDGIMYNVMNQEAALAAFRSGRIDCGCAFDTDFQTPNRAALKRELPDIQLVEFWSHAYLYFKQEAPWTDPRVRQAISVGLDRRTFAQALQDGFAHFPGAPFFGPEVGGQWGLSRAEMLQIPGWREDRNADTTLSKQLFAQAGIDPKTLTPIYLGPTQFGPDMTIIDSLLRGMGMTPKLDISPSTADITPKRQQGQYAISHETPSASFDDPIHAGARYVISTDPGNYAKWSNPEIDKLFADIDTELDPVKRKAIAKDLQRKLIDWAVIVTIPHTGRAQGPRGYVKGYAHVSPVSVDVSGRLERVWLDR